MAPRSTDPFPDAVAAFIALAWLGMLLGISFLATPVKFQAHSLDFPVALEVGRVTFATYSKVEWGLSLLLVIATFFPKASRPEIVFTAATVLVVAVQALWLLPILDARVEAVISGKLLLPSMHHTIYAAGEVAKAAALVAVALIALFRLGWRDDVERSSA
ncbi:DUF4149 domain-containing protein [Nitratireductor mangrovi]|uniref:DUF4149 domain-containing protein n=1 Tax=Nitratireductor mangrovi TaxID=2599600 RepID=A0A5B8KXB8_9HYPH|nr:DUF4149 domain-containing protein [Nitratireductor mangrovi]QDZ00231.1 DUF4149 domain-containing protein [Nitratireductor mangrovi]